MKTEKILLITIFPLLFLTLILAGCSEDETYGKKKERERSTIHTFLNNGVCVIADSTSEDTTLFVKPIKVISEETFAAQDSTTNLEENEYVLMAKTGVYMQIVNKGSGEKLESGKTATILTRFLEYNLSADSIQTTNNTLYYVAVPDEMTCSNSYGNYTASFISGVMKTKYSTSSVPEGWLIPLPYINLGRDTRDLAKVRIIVPHSSGQSDAQQYVYACFYEITYQKGR
jgi:hypothetical protein